MKDEVIIMKIKKIEDTYAMDMEGQRCIGHDTDCCYDCAHWKNNTGANPSKCTCETDKEITNWY